MMVVVVEICDCRADDQTGPLKTGWTRKAEFDRDKMPGLWKRADEGTDGVRSTRRPKMVVVVVSMIEQGERLRNLRELRQRMQ